MVPQGSGPTPWVGQAKLAELEGKRPFAAASPAAPVQAPGAAVPTVETPVAAMPPVETPAPSVPTVVAPGEKRVALVIGNSAYAGDAALTNPANDAQDIGGTFESLGFDASPARTGPFDGIRAAMLDFAVRLAAPTSRSCSTPAMPSRSATRIG